MTAETFFEKFELFADAPNAVKKLRELVLELAVSGRLLRNNVPSSDWEEETLKNLTTKVGSGATPKGGKAAYHDKGTPLIRSMNVLSMAFSMEGLVFLSQKQADELRNVVVQPNDVLLNITGASIGRAVVVPNVMAGARVNQHVSIIRPTERLLPKYLELFLSSPSVQHMIGDVQVGATREALTKGMIEQFRIPLPPLAEQEHIVAKVDELMALCDRLEDEQQERATLEAKLACAATARLLGRPTVENVEIIFHQSLFVSPMELRKIIHYLAIRGKLVPQDESEETAKAALIRCGVCERELLNQTQYPYPIPNSWAWISFYYVGNQRLGKMLDRQKNRGDLKPYLRNTNVQWMHFDLTDIKKMRIVNSEVEELKLKKGDLIICEGGEPGRCAIWKDEVPEMYFQKALHRVRPHPAILPEFLAICLQHDCQNGVLDSFFTGATIKHLTGRSLRQYAVPIPPFEEQKRILKKVDELLGLVERYKAELSEKRSSAKLLLEAVMEELVGNDYR